MKADEYYERLLYEYQRWYSNPKPVVDAVIKKLMEERGLTWEEAVVALYRKVCEVGASAEAEGRRRATAFTIAEEKLGLGAALRLAIGSFYSNPQLALPALLGEAAPSLTTLALAVIALWALWRIQEENATALLIRALREDIGLILQPPLLGIVIYAVIAAVLVALVLGGLGRATEAAFIYKASERALRSGHVDFGDVWSEAIAALPRTLLTALLEDLLALGLPLAVLLLVISGGLQLFRGNVEALLAAVVIALPLIALYVLVAKVALVFALPSTVIGGRSPLRAIAESLKLFGTRTAETFGYVLLRGGVELVIGILVALLAECHLLLGEFAALLLLIVRPIFSVALTALYMPVAVTSVRSKREKSLVRRALAALARGLSELRALGKEPRWVLLSLLVFLCGTYGGYVFAQGELGVAIWELATKDGEPIIEKYAPLSIFADIFFHNWRIAAFTSVSGVYTVLAPATIALFNGFVLGFVCAMINPVEVLAGIVPHGVIELPSFLLAVAAGIRLFFRLLRSKRPAAELYRAAYVAVGLAPFFLLAAFVEVFITPRLLELVAP